MLNQYVSQTQRLLQNPGAPTPLYAVSDVTNWINLARGQLAGESECIRFIGTLSTTVGLNVYNFSAISTGSANGVQAVLKIKRIFYNVGQGQRRVNGRPWQWFDYYHLNNPVPASGAPKTWAQYAQGSAPGVTGSEAASLGGSFYLDPLPNIIYTLNLDCVCFPIALALDSDPEAIPYLFTDCVPYLAAWYALLSSQTSARVGDAERMYNYYETFLDRAKKAGNPNEAQDPVQATKLGIKAQAGGAAG